MFFLISKIFGFVSSPVTYIALLVIAGMWLRKKRWKQLTFGLAIFQYRLIDFFPDFYYLSQWEELIHEWIGMLVYNITG